MIHGTVHISYGDALLFIAIPGVANLGVGRTHEIVNAYTLAFFDRYLRDQPSALLQEARSAQFPEASLRRRN